MCILGIEKAPLPGRCVSVLGQRVMWAVLIGGWGTPQVLRTSMLLPGCYYVTRLEHPAWNLMLPEGKNCPSPPALPTETGQAPPTADLRPTWSRARVALLLCWEQRRVGVPKRNASAGRLPGGQEGRCVPPLTPHPPSGEVSAPSLCPQARRPPPLT